MLTPKEVESLKKAALEIRRAKKPLSALIFSAMAKGIWTRSRKSIAGLVSGYAEFSPSWARGMMEELGFRVRSATTDRTVSAQTVVEEGAIFYAELKPHSDVEHALLFNFDEFFCALDASQRWTWERVKKGEKSNIAIAKKKKASHALYAARPMAKFTLCSASSTGQLTACMRGT